MRFIKYQKLRTKIDSKVIVQAAASVLVARSNYTLLPSNSQVTTTIFCLLIFDTL